MSSQPMRSTLDGLPKQFVASMRTLFDIMDENSTGLIRFGDIETRWREDDLGTAASTTATRKLPKGVIECLRKVTPANGMLTFERFCAGLKICLLRNRSEYHLHQAGNGKPPLGPTTGSHLATPGLAAKKVVPSQTVTPTVTRPFLSTLGPGSNSPLVHHDQDRNKDGGGFADGRGNRIAAGETLQQSVQPRPNFGGGLPPLPAGAIPPPSGAIPPLSSAIPTLPSGVISDMQQPQRIGNDGRDIHLRSHSNSGTITTATVRPNISFQQRAVSMPLLGSDKNSKNGVTKSQDTFAEETYRDAGVSAHESSSSGNVVGVRTELRGYRSELRISSGTAAPQGGVQQSRTAAPIVAAAIVPTDGTNWNRDTAGGGGGGTDYGSNGGSGYNPGITGGCGSVYNAGPTTMVNHARSRRGIMTVLHNWHMGMLNEAAATSSADNRTRIQTTNIRTNAAAIRQRSQSAHVTRLDDLGGGVASDGDIGMLHADEVTTTQLSRKGHPRRREPRRHTLANGIDYNMLKRMKQLEQEKDVLLQGLEAVDKARTWYLKQIVSVQEKMKYIGQSNGHLEYSTEAHQERLNFQMAQIFEVNQHLSALVESTERGFPLHMNLAVRQPAQSYFKKSQQAVAGGQQHGQELAVHHLKELNHLLSEEVSKKSERITQLEKEKAALVRELFQARASSRRESDDVTLM